MAKPKLDFKKLLVARGEYIALGVAGFFLALMLLWGATKGSSAKDPAKIAGELKGGAQRVQTALTDPNAPIGEQDATKADLPPWVKATPEIKPVSVKEFPTTGPLFDPIAKPDTKKENPMVLPIGGYQVDLVRAPMMGYDRISDGQGSEKIAVISSKILDKFDQTKAKEFITNIKNKGRPQPKAAGVQPQPQPKGGFGGPQPPGGGGLQPPGGGGGIGGVAGPGPGAGAGGFGEGGGGGYGLGNPYGGNVGSGYDQGGQRVEKTIEYVSLDELDEAGKNGKIPAMTVIPLRMIMIQAEVNLKDQLVMLQKALRLSSPQEALNYGPVYDGFEVRRKVSRILPSGKVEVINDFAPYNFEDKYQDLIYIRKMGDHLEDGYLSYFIRYDMNLALPLPQLVSELGKYPAVRLESINKTVKKLQEMNKPRIDPSDLLQRLRGGSGRGALYAPQGFNQTGAGGIGYGGSFQGPGGEYGSGTQPPLGKGGFGGGGIVPQPKGGGQAGVLGTGPGGTGFALPPVEIEHLLLRFVDVDVKPGYTYEYQIQLRMKNPNFGDKKGVSKAADAEKELLYSPWAAINAPLTVPAESFLYAADVAAYRKRIEDEYNQKDQRDLLKALQAKDNQAVVEVLTWTEEVRTEAAGKREPVGAWVLADLPVGRGEFIGRKQYVKLPLWSSEIRQYVLREVQDLVTGKTGGGKEQAKPRGWLVDFSTKSVLVDFEGGKVRTKTPTREVLEDAATEMLVVRPDGKLVVMKSADDERNADRKKFADEWDSWIKTVEARKATGTGTGNEYEKGGKGGP